LKTRKPFEEVCNEGEMGRKKEEMIVLFKEEEGSTGDREHTWEWV
jgi:hypothetical protein